MGMGELKGEQEVLHHAGCEMPLGIIRSSEALSSGQKDALEKQFNEAHRGPGNARQILIDEYSPEQAPLIILEGGEKIGEISVGGPGTTTPNMTLDVDKGAGVLTDEEYLNLELQKAIGRKAIGHKKRHSHIEQRKAQMNRGILGRLFGRKSLV